MDGSRARRRAFERPTVLVPPTCARCTRDSSRNEGVEVGVGGSETCRDVLGCPGAHLLGAKAETGSGHPGGCPPIGRQS